MHYVLVLMAVAVVAILVAVVIVAMGRGGEMAHFPNDYAPPDFGALAATDVALLRPPTALWGYNMQLTDEALNGIAMALSERDVRIASLERQLSDLGAGAPLAVAGGRPPTPAPQPGSPWPGNAAGNDTAIPAGPWLTRSSGAVAEDTGSAGPPPSAPRTPAGTGWAGPAGTARAGPAGTKRPRGDTESTGDSGPTGYGRTSRDAKTPHSLENGTAESGGASYSGTGWPQPVDRLAAAGEPNEVVAGEPGSAPDVTQPDWPGWPGWPGASALRQDPHTGAQPEAPQPHPPPDMPAGPQSDEEESW